MNIDAEIKQIDKAISELVYPKTALRKAYNYYHGKRDAEQFKHIEENYGLGTPTNIMFNPLVRPHIDRLVGEYLGLNQDLKVSCKDSETISGIMREKQLQITQATQKHLQKFLENNIISAILAEQEVKVDPLIEEQINKIVEDIEDSFVSSYEIAAQNILQYFKQSKNIDLLNKMQNLLTDLCISGTCYFRVKPTSSADNIQLEVLNPLNTFIEKNPNSEYLADSYRAVVRKYMSVEDIVMEYSPFLQEKHIKILKNGTGHSTNDGMTVYITTTQPEYSMKWTSDHPGVLGGLEAHPIWSDGTVSNNRGQLWTVYDVEWIEIDYSTGMQYRHEGTKIGDEIYITKGVSEYIIRTKDYPNKCRLSVNGLFFLDKNGDPNSMIIKTMDLQDKYDLLAFYRDNLIASSGTVGDWVDIPMLPTYLGDTPQERLQKWLSYKKQGTALLDTSQDGMQGANLNTIFNGYDDTVRADSINAIEMVMQTIKNQVSMVTGVLPEALAQYEQRDAVSNVQLGVRTTVLLTKQLFSVMDTVYKEVNYDMLNLAKLVWKEGITGTLILGNYAKIFEALPESYTVTDFDIHIEDSTQSYQNMQSLVAISGELVKGGVVDLSDVTTIMTASSLNELKRNIDKSIARKKEETDTINQLQQQLQQADQAMQESQKNQQQLEQYIQKLEKQLEKQQQHRLDMDAARLELDKERVRNDKEYNDRVLEVKRQQVNNQRAEIYDSNSYNDKIKSVV